MTEAPIRGAQWRRAAWLVLGLLALSGCDTLGLALGTRMRLSNIPVWALSLRLAPQPAMSPGALAQLVVTATTADGAQRVTVGTESGKVLFGSFEIDAQVVAVGPRGKLHLPADPRVSLGWVPQVLQVRVLVNQAREMFSQVDPQGGSLSLRSEGGPGGVGGPGGRGGPGGQGGDGFPRGTTGFTGSDGSSGRSGRDGEPGRIIVSVDPRPLPYLDRFDIVGRGHVAGPGSQVMVEPVAPWC